jgi:hypothetical protein
MMFGCRLNVNTQGGIGHGTCHFLVLSFPALPSLAETAARACLTLLCRCRPFMGAKWSTPRLCENCIGDVGMKALAGSLKRNSALTEFFLRGTAIGAAPLPDSTQRIGVSTLGLQQYRQ